MTVIKSLFSFGIVCLLLISLPTNLSATNGVFDKEIITTRVFKHIDITKTKKQSVQIDFSTTRKDIFKVDFELMHPPIIVRPKVVIDDVIVFLDGSTTPQDLLVSVDAMESMNFSSRHCFKPES